MLNVGDFVETKNGHSGIITKLYKVTGVGLYCHIKESDGKIYYCPVAYLK